MTLIADLIFSVILIFCGYGATYFYSRQTPLKDARLSELKLSKHGLAYLSVVFIIAVALIALFHLIYRQNLLTQLRLLALVLSIAPMAAVDYRVRTIPNSFLLVALLMRIALLIAEFCISPSDAWETAKACLIGATVIGAFFLLLYLIIKNGMGAGDVKLFALIGFYQGIWGALTSVFFSLVAAFIISIFLLLAKKKNRKDSIPFGPCIFIGTVVAVGLSGM